MSSKITIKFQYLDNSGVEFFDLGIVTKEKGQLDLHGRKFYPTWTRLSGTIGAGENSAKLQVKIGMTLI